MFQRKVSRFAFLVLALNLNCLWPALAEAADIRDTGSIKVEKPEDINPVFELGSRAYENQKYNEAIEIFKKITTKFPGYADAHYYIALSYFGLGDYYQSLAFFLEANKIYGREKLDALFGAGLAYLSSGYTDEAKRAFETVVRESTDQELVMDARNWIQSINEQILQKEKLDLLTTDINFREGIEYLDARQYIRAESAFRKALANKPNSVLSLYYLGNTLYLLEKYNEAIEAFEKVVLIDPDSKIAEDARLYTRVIQEITATLPNARPYFFNASLGTLYDSNLSYSDNTDIIIADLAGTLGLGAGYILNENLQFQYNYYGSIFSGINDNLPGLTLRSRDFNLQRHNLNARGNYPLLNNINGEADYNFNWYSLGGESFLFSNSLTPRAYYYFSPDLVAMLQYRLGVNTYPVFFTRNNVSHAVSLYQYYYFPGNMVWVRGGYDFEKIFANDQLQEQNGFLTDGSNFNLKYQFANSLHSNSLSLDLGVNSLWFNSQLRVFGKATLSSYDNPDIYILTSPITDITTGTPEIRIIRNINKIRQDILFNIGFIYSIPLINNVNAHVTYNFMNNNSNISNDDFISRSYLKQMLNINFTYDF